MRRPRRQRLNWSVAWRSLTLAGAFLATAGLVAAVGPERTDSRVARTDLTADARSLAGTNDMTGAWRSVGPWAGPVNRLAFDPASPAVVWAASPGGAFRSADGGATWSRTAFAGQTVLAVVPHPTEADLVFAITPAGLERSTDGGTSWAPVGSVPSTSIADVALVPGAPQRIVLATSGGMLSSSDGGGTWTTAVGLPPHHPSVQQVVVDSSPEPAVYAIANGTLYRSADGGASVAVLVADGCTWLSIDPRSPATLYLARSGEVLKSNDSGAMWSPAGSGLPSGLPLGYQVALAPSRPDTVYAISRAGLFASRDGGGTWTPGGDPGALGPYGREIPWLAIDPLGDRRLLAGTALDGVQVSSDGGAEWEPASAGLSTVHVSSLMAEPLGRVLAGTLWQGIFRSDDGLATWRETGMGAGAQWIFEVPDFDVVELRGDPRRSGRVLAATRRGLSVSDDLGNHWQTLPVGHNVNGLVLDPESGDTLYATAESGMFQGGGVLRSTDGGTAWTDTTSGLGAVWADAIAIDPVDRRTLLVVGSLSGPGEPPFLGLLASPDRGASWQRRGAFAGALAYGGTGTLIADSSTPGLLLVGHRNGILRSTDGGWTWATADDGIPCNGEPPWCARGATLVQDPLIPAIFYAGTESGVYRSADRGETWAPLGNGLDGLSISALAVDATRRLLLAGTSNCGVFVHELAAPSVPRTILRYH